MWSDHRVMEKNRGPASPSLCSGRVLLSKAKGAHSHAVLDVVCHSHYWPIIVSAPVSQQDNLANCQNGEKSLSQSQTLFLAGTRLRVSLFPARDSQQKPIFVREPLLYSSASQRGMDVSSGYLHYCHMVTAWPLKDCLEELASIYYLCFLKKTVVLCCNRFPNHPLKLSPV